MPRSRRIRIFGRALNPPRSALAAAVQPRTTTSHAVHNASSTAIDGTPGATIPNTDNDRAAAGTAGGEAKARHSVAPSPTTTTRSPASPRDSDAADVAHTPTPVSTQPRSSASGSTPRDG